MQPFLFENSVVGSKSLQANMTHHLHPMQKDLTSHVLVKIYEPVRFPTIWYFRPAKPQISSSLGYSMIVKLLTEQNLEFLSLEGVCTESSGSTLVNIYVKLLEISGLI